MKKLVTMFLTVILTGTMAMAVEISLLPGYGLLLSPDLSDIEDIPGATVSKGGISFAVQGLLGEGDLKYGAELGYMTLYDWKYSEEIPFFGGITLEMEMKESLTSIPIMGVVKYNLDEGDYVPYLTSALGLHICTVKAAVLSLPMSETKTYLGFSLGAGAKVKVDEKTNLDILLRYNNIMFEGDAVSTLGISAGVGFRL